MKAQLAGAITFAIAINFLIAGGGGQPKREDIPKYIKTLKSPNAKPADKVIAADMIGKRGAVNIKDVEDAIDPLRAVAQKDRDAAARKAAIHALGSIAPDDKETVPLLIQILKSDKAADVKRASVEALARFGPRAKEALPAIQAYGKTLDKKEKRFIQTVTSQIKGVSK